jgi:heptosyltransferase-2
MKKILIIRLSSLGDIVLTEPICQKLKDNFPEAEITFITKPMFKKLAAGFRSVDKVILWKDKPNLLLSLKKEKYDLVIDLHDKLSSWLIRWFSGSKTVVYRKQHFLRKRMIKHLTKVRIYSTVDLYASVFEKLSIDQEWHFPKLIPNPKLDKKINEVFLNFSVNRKETLIGIYPGASFETKRYPLAYLIKFINMVPDSWNCRFVLLGSNADKPDAVKIYKSVNKKVIDLTGVFKIHELPNAMNEIDGFITNDSGPMHIAAALEKPQIAIFGATHTKLGFRPLNNNAVIIQNELHCRPCHLHGSDTCPKGHFHCMLQITPETLFKEFKKLYEENILGV